MKTKLDKGVLTYSEFIHIYNERKAELETGWITEFRRIEYNKHVNSIVFDNVITSYTSASIRCGPFKTHRALITLSVTAVPTTLQIQKQFSYDNINFFNATELPWSTLIYEDSAGAQADAVPGVLDAEWMRYKVTAVGTTAANKFTLTLEDLMIN